MSRKKGLSMEEKIDKIEGYFHKHPVPFTMKELESAIPKATGVIPQSVAECIELLVSEGRVVQDKVGVFVLFWYFPATASERLVQQRATLEAAVQRLTTESGALREQGDAATETSDALDERAKLDAQIRELCARQHVLDRALCSSSDTDPAVFDGLVRATGLAREAVNRWTDTILTLEHTAKRTAGLDGATFRRQFGVPRDLEFIE